MQVIIDLPENLAINLQAYQGNLPQILELGLREYKANSLIGYKSAADILEFLAGLPTAEETLALRPAIDLQEKINEMLEKSRRAGLSESEEQTWANYEFIEHLVRVAKAKALRQLEK